MRVLIADKFEQLGLDRLENGGCDVFYEPSLAADDLAFALAEHKPDILIVRSTKVRADAIDAAAQLKLIVRAGAGYDTIDVVTASREGIFVANCPGKNAIAVAELAWALILACDRRIADQTADLRKGTWNKKLYGKARGIYGRTLGILGLGRIALEVATRARAFGMDVVAWSRSLTPERAQELGLRYADAPLAIARQADIVSVHVASTPATAKLVDDDFIDAMKPGATLINTSRGAVVDEAALMRGIRDKGLRVGLDVYANEPSSGGNTFDSEIARDPSVVGSHHIGASTDQAQQAIAIEAVRVIERYRSTGEVANCVNRAQKSSATCILTVRHRNRPGVLASVFQVISEAGINVEEMENLLYQGAESACARIQLGSAPNSDHLKEIRSRCADILSMELSPIATKGA